MNAATGLDFSDPPDPDPCWHWWEATGVNANEWYVVGIDTLSDAVFFTVTTTANGDTWYDGTSIADWSDLDGLTIPWFGQFGTSPCPGGDPGDVLIELPP